MNEQAPIRILLVDDHPLMRRGMRDLLAMEDDLQPVGEAGTGEEALRLVDELDPDLILLDLNMTGMSGVETLSTLRDLGIESRIILVTVSNAPEDVVAAIRAGADGYILKDNEPDEMLALIDAAMHGRTAISPELTSLLATVLREERIVEQRSQVALTERETAILKYLAAGMSNKLIARELDIMEGTVKVHIRNLLKKLKFRSRVEAAVWAVANGLS